MIACPQSLCSDKRAAHSARRFTPLAMLSVSLLLGDTHLCVLPLLPEFDLDSNLISRFVRLLKKFTMFFAGVAGIYVSKIRSQCFLR